jgi:hypothetical protein
MEKEKMISGRMAKVHSGNVGDAEPAEGTPEKKEINDFLFQCSLRRLRIPGIL